jgi:hypothetical protein
MKLISNYKDYYDYLIGAKYGIDEKAVYERICSTEGNDSKWYKSGIYRPLFLDNLRDYDCWEIHFCGTRYYGHFYDGQYYYGKEAMNYIPARIKNGAHSHRGMCSEPILTGGTINNEFGLTRLVEDYNEKHNCPVLVSHSYNGLIKNPKLLDFGFNKIISPDEAFLKITNFLLREKPVVNNQTDKEKIVSHGFDTKTSFRKM